MVYTVAAEVARPRQRPLISNKLAVLVVVVFGLLTTVDTVFAGSKTKVLHFFSGKDGETLQAKLIADATGNLYGTTFNGGTPSGCDGAGCGVVFELSPSASGKWTETVLHSFDGSDGANPNAGLIFDGAGNLYGTTAFGGTTSSRCQFRGSCGVIFELSPSGSGKWTETVLHSFDGNDGGNPTADLIFDGVGNLYGTTFFGGTTSSHCLQQETCGVVFELSPAGGGKWTETVLHFFDGSDGGNPYAGLVFDANGNLFGTTAAAGAHNGGMVFELSPENGQWTETVLLSAYSYPFGNLIFDAKGNLYGTTSHGPSHAAHRFGSVFKLTPGSNGKWIHTALHFFNDKDGFWPYAGLIFDATGNLYGTTASGGTYGRGAVFKLTHETNGKWGETVMHSFNGKNGSAPFASLIFDPSGNLYGTTLGADAKNCNTTCGVVFEITP